MLLAIDAGNTNIVFAVFDDKTLLKQWRIATDPKRTLDEYAILITQLMQREKIEASDITDSIISTVVPGVLFALKSLCKKIFETEPLVISEPGVYTGMHIAIERSGDVGADRLVNAIAAYKKFGGDIIIVDFGTATTFDLVNRAGDYIGGIIAPGINLSLDALHMAAAKLPLVAIESPEKVIGTSTVSAMQSGIFWGYVGLVDGLIQKIIEEYQSPMRTIVTGGLGNLFFKEMDSLQHLEPDLTMYGLQAIFETNQTLRKEEVLDVEKSH